jgi:hypothetical protein
MALANRLQRLSALRAAAATLIFSLCVGAAAAPADYMLDDASGKYALYSGPAYRCFVTAKDTVASLDELKCRIAKLPAGTKVYWMPYLRESSGEPILFAKGQFAQFAKFCAEHKVALIVDGEK